MILADAYDIHGDDAIWEPQVSDATTADPGEPATVPEGINEVIEPAGDDFELRVHHADPDYGIRYSAELDNDLPGETEIYGDSDPVEPDEIPADLAFDMALIQARSAPTVAGDVVMPSTSYEAVRAAASRAILQPQPLKGEQRDWDINFGPAFGPAGAVVVITARPQVVFRGEKLIATDTSERSGPGRGTRVIQVAVGQRIQRPGADNGTLTSMFAATALANGIKFDTAHPWEDIKVTVSFVEQCTFDASVFGKAVL